MRWVKISLLAVAALAGLYVIADFIFVSDEERIEVLMDEGEQAVEEGDYTAIEAMVSLEYDYDKKNREEFLDTAGEVLNEYSPMSLMLMGEQITFDGDDEASVRFLGIVTPKEGSKLPSAVKCRWLILFRKEEGDWKITGVKPVM